MVVVVIAIAGAATLVATWYSHKNQVIPLDIQKRLNFSPYLAMGDSSNGATMSNFKYDPSSKVFSYILRPANKQKLTVSEQVSPPNFTEIPNLYSKLLNGLNKFGSVQTFNGTAYLTRPQNNSEVAVLNNQGVLLFIKSPQNNLSNGQWKRIIESLDIYKIQGN